MDNHLYKNCFKYLLILLLIICMGLSIFAPNLKSSGNAISATPQSVGATPSTSNNTTNFSKELKVLVINQDPYLSKVGKYLSDFVATDRTSYVPSFYRDWEVVCNEYVNNINTISEGTVTARIVETIQYNAFPKYKKLINLSNSTTGYSLDEDTWLSMMTTYNKFTGYKMNWENWGNTTYGQQFSDFTFGDYDYNSIIDKYNLVDKKNNGDFDVVWLIDYQQSYNYESCIVGRSAYWDNGDAIIKDCDNFHIMSVSAVRSETYLECLGHSAEFTLNWAYENTWEIKPPSVSTQAQFNNLNNWHKFLQRDYAAPGVLLSPGYGVAGNVHYAPNSTDDYEWSNINYSYSSYLDFKNNYTNLTNVKQQINKTTWVGLNSWDQMDNLSHKKWWFSIMPNFAGRDADGFSNNWFSYIFNTDWARSISNTKSTWTYHIGDTINNITYSVPYYSGVTQTYNVDKISRNTTIISGSGIVYVDGNNNLIANSAGTATIRTYFDGWYVDTTIQVLGNNYTISYNNNGGSGSITSYQVSENSSFTTAGLSSGITRSGYVLTGWQVGTSSHVLSLSTSYLINTVATYAGVSYGGIIVLKAQWQQVTCSVSLNANAGSSGVGLTTIYAKSGSSTYYTSSSCTTAVSLSGGNSNSFNVPTKNGYTFLGYADSATNLSANYIAYNNGTFSVLKSWDKSGSSATLYAIFSKKITLTTNDYVGTGVRAITYDTYLYNNNTSVSFSIGSFGVGTYTGWNTLGWVADTTIPATILPSSYAISNDTTIYGYYSKSVILTYDVNGGNAISNQNKTIYAITNITLSKASFTLPTPTKTGCIFSSWNTNSDGSGTSYSANSIIEIVNNLTLFAQWQTNSYSITLNSNNGTSGVGLQVVYASNELSNYYTNSSCLNAVSLSGGNSNSFNLPTKSGYSFLGYADSASETTANYISYNSGTFSIVKSWDKTENGTLYAIYKKTITLTYKDFYNGSLRTRTDTKNVFNNNTEASFTLLNIGSYSDWTAFAWTFDTTSTTSNFEENNVVINQNRTLYAYYKKDIKLLYDAQGGESVGGFNYTKYFNASGATTEPSITLPTTTKTNYTFNSWNTQSDGNGTKYYVGQSYTFDSNLTFYAIWRGQLIKVNLNANTGTNGTGLTTVYGEFNTKNYYTTNTGETLVNLVANTSTSIYLPNKTGYTFKGYATTNTSETANYIGFADNTFEIKENVELTSETILYAVYEKVITLTLIDYTNTTKATRQITQKIYNATESYAFTLPSINSYTNWEILGWASETLPTGALITTPNYTISNNQTLYALYRQEITITYDLQGGASVDVLKDYRYYNSSDAVKNVSATMPTTTKTGYNLLYWKNGDTIYQKNQTYEFSQDITLIAEWFACKFFVEFNANGGTTPPERIEIIYDIETTLPLYNGTRKGYEFDGWAESLNGETKFNNNDTILTSKISEIFEEIGENGTYILYANWYLIDYEITIQTNNNNYGEISVNNSSFGSSSGNTQDITSTINIQARANDGYKFIKWTIEDGETIIEDANLATTTISNISENTIIQALFVPITFEVIIYSQISTNAQSNVGGIITATGIYYDQTTGELTNSSLENNIIKIANNSNISIIAEALEKYDFVGWYDSQESIEKINNLSNYSFEVTENSTLFARFIPKKLEITFQTKLENKNSTYCGQFNSIAGNYYESVNGLLQENSLTNVASGKIYVAYNSAIKLTQSTNIGYNFINYYLNNEVFTSEESVVQNNCEIIAEYEPETYTLTFKNFIEDTHSIIVWHVKYNSKIMQTELPQADNQLTKVFENWTIDNVVITNESVWTYTEDKTALAQWSAKLFKVILNSGSGVAGQGFSEVFVEYNTKNFYSSLEKTTEITLTPSENSFNLPTKDGYSFIGYSSSSTSNIANYISFENNLFEILIDNYTLTEDITLYAIFEKEIFLTYHYFGGTETDKIVVYNSINSAQFTLKDITNAKYAKNSWLSYGWSTQAPSTNLDMSKVIEENNIILSTNRDIYAIYEYNVEILFMTYNGGSIEKNVSIYSDINSNIKTGSLTISSAPTREGHEFKYWTLNEDFSGTKYYIDNNLIISNTQNIVLYAYYETMTFNITFFNEDGSEILFVVEKSYGELFDPSNYKVEKEQIPESYTFKGWTLVTNKKIMAKTFIVEGNVNLYAYIVKESGLTDEAILIIALSGGGLVVGGLTAFGIAKIVAIRRLKSAVVAGAKGIGLAIKPKFSSPNTTTNFTNLKTSNTINNYYENKTQASIKRPANQTQNRVYQNKTNQTGNNQKPVNIQQQASATQKTNIQPKPNVPKTINGQKQDNLGTTNIQQRPTSVSQGRSVPQRPIPKRPPKPPTK